MHDMLVAWKNMFQQFDMPFQHNYWVWKVIGIGGTVVFMIRALTQWLHSEIKGESKVSPLYWWLSVLGTLLLLAYGIRQKDSVIILGYLFNSIPYMRNLMLIYSRRAKEKDVSGALSTAPGSAA